MAKDTYPYPQEDLEFAGAWGHAAEKSVTLAGVVKRLQIRAGELYVEDKTEIADELKRFATIFDEERIQASENLQGYIKESARRNGR